MILKGKKGVIFGVANKISLAWSIAQEAVTQGADITLCVANERFRDKIAPMAAELGLAEPIICDVASDESIQSTFKELAGKVGQIDFMVHAIAFANREDLQGRFADTSREGYHVAQDISSYSLCVMAKEAEKIMPEGGSIVTLSYIGAKRAIPGYNVMGVAKASLEASVRYLAADLGPSKIRVNAVSAGPVKTLSSSAVSGLKEKLDLHIGVCPLRRNITQKEVGDATAFLASDLASGVTGDVLYVDCGYHIAGRWD